MKSLIFGVVLALVVSGCFPQLSIAADKPDKPEGKAKAWVAGKVYDVDKTTPLVDVPIRVVKVDNGEVTEEKSHEDGCYRFKDVKKGSYSLAVSYKGMDYMLPEKIMVEDVRQRDVAVAICVAIPEKGNALVLLDNCHVCLGAGFPPIGIAVIGGAAAVGGILIGRNQEAVVSESRPHNR